MKEKLEIKREKPLWPTGPNGPAGQPTRPQPVSPHPTHPLPPATGGRGGCGSHPSHPARRMPPWQTSNASPIRIRSRPASSPSRSNPSAHFPLSFACSRIHIAQSSLVAMAELAHIATVVPGP